jgi:hypothetical protein
MAAKVEQVVLDARQLREEHAQELRPDRHFEIEKLLDGEHEAVLHGHGRAIIEAIEIGEGLQVGLILGKLLGAAVEQPDMGIDAFDDFAIELEDKPQYAVRCRMLGTEIDREVLDASFFSALRLRMHIGIDLVAMFRLRHLLHRSLSSRLPCVLAHPLAR